MNILYAFLITLIVYSTIGTLLFALVENLKTSIKNKILIMTSGHPIVVAVLLWFACSFFNSDIAITGVLIVAGTLLRVPFSDKKYLLTFVSESGVVTIEYFSELLRRNTIKLTTSAITGFEQSFGRHLFDKPSTLTVTVSDKTIKFKILDTTTKISL